MPRVRDVVLSCGAALRRAGLAAFRFFGPVAGSVKGRLSGDEVHRALAKAVVAAGTGAGAASRILKDPDVLAVVVIPAIVGAVVGLLDAISRYQQGGQEKPS